MRIRLQTLIKAENKTMTIPEQIASLYTERFGGSCEVLVRASGRINIIGEHTDYNDGFVLPAAVNKSIKCQLTKNGTAHSVNIHSENIGNTFSVILPLV